MATRILVQCKTEDMPGEYSQKSLLMANIACQAIWNRDFNSNPPDYDRLTSYGGWMNSQCVLLIDNGAVDEKHTLVHFRWQRNELVRDSGRVHPYIQKELDTTYHFNPAKRPESNGLTDEELKKVLSPEAFEKCIRSIEEMTARHNAKIQSRSKDVV